MRDPAGASPTAFSADHDRAVRQDRWVALLAWLTANEKTLVGVCKELAAAVSTHERISPAGDDGVAQQGNFVHLADDGHDHWVEVRAAVNSPVTRLPQA